MASENDMKMLASLIVEFTFSKDTINAEENFEYQHILNED